MKQNNLFVSRKQRWSFGQVMHIDKNWRSADHHMCNKKEQETRQKITAMAEFWYFLKEDTEGNGTCKPKLGSLFSLSSQFHPSGGGLSTTGVIDLLTYFDGSGDA